MRAPKLLFLLCLFAGSTATQVTGCAEFATFDHPAVPVVDDSSLTSSVRAAIANEAGPGAAMNVNVATTDGTVRLSGFVDSQHASLRAEQIARSIEGVRAVRNELNVAPRPRYSSSTTGVSVPQ